MNMSITPVSVRRVLIVEKPYKELEPASRWMERGRWPCSWISISDAADRPVIAAYRCRCTLNQPETLRLHVTADERYEFYIDGVLIGRGPERGDDENWFFETLTSPSRPGSTNWWLECGHWERMPRLHR